MVVTLVYPWGTEGWCTSPYGVFGDIIVDTIDDTDFWRLGGRFHIGIGGKVLRKETYLKKARIEAWGHSLWIDAPGGSFFCV